MSAIIPIFVSADRLNWIIALPSEESVCYVCSSTKLRNAINQRFEEEGVADSEALHYKEIARTMIQAIKQVTGNNLEAISFSDGNGKFLTISKTSCEHNFDPTQEEKSESKSASPRNGENLSKRQADILARLKKLSE
ncbi:MAG: hypothetical protein H8E46_06580 [FCB group bacterium]|nr:hypothetical protein [FCB group bacterium]